MNRNQVRLAVVSMTLMLALFPVGFAAGARTSSPATLQAESLYAEEATQVSVELSKGIDSRSSKPGQEVTGKIVAEARLADGTTLPKGSRLVGHVTAVQASTRDNPNGQVTVLFDHVVARDGRPIPVHALLLGIRMPPHATPPPMPGSDVAGMGRGGIATPGMAGASANGPGGMDGSGMSGGGSNGPANGPDPGAASGAGPVNMPPSAASSTSPTGATAGPAGAVGGLPGVTWGNVAVGANGATPPPPGSPTAVLFSGQGRNVTLDGGAQMVLAVTPQQPAAQ